MRDIFPAVSVKRIKRLAYNIATIEIHNYTIIIVCIDKKILSTRRLKVKTP